MTQPISRPRNVVVTGATGAIGAAIVEQLYARGIECIIAACRRTDAVDAMRRDLKTLHPDSPTRIVASPLDLATRQSARDAAHSILTLDLPLDAVINNAGTMPLRVPTLSPEGIDLATQVNLLSTLAFAQELLPAMQPGSVMVFTSSIARHIPTAGPDYLERAARASGIWGLFYNYSRSKLLLTRAARLLADREHPKGIRINCADPGIVDTPLLRTGYSLLDGIIDTLARPLMNIPAKGARAAIRAIDTPYTAAMATPFKSTPIPPLTPLQAQTAAQVLAQSAL
ncbi:MAG: SDR family NAD(P)-dependent oxidoreductase [Candidatus Amulumruptor caecigallinarius]|nr:SDR family NAD(P)-dependent oxidoreductase [Candidatus Amulumruptor caecigallinarius]MCM1396515.1 SDR family NAD(P)-dependent oxidoreductase [Candidatus Amulumruptor caecigallinarius]MCM1453427.1 SDR family NAD(P)-dependent oxidoreductase [bacterium]